MALRAETRNPRNARNLPLCVLCALWFFPQRAQVNPQNTQSTQNDLWAAARLEAHA
jgi:hypothetical protein